MAFSPDRTLAFHTTVYVALLLLTEDFCANTAIGEELQQDGMRDAAVNDMGFANAMMQRV
jgi:hypothetical protein